MEDLSENGVKMVFYSPKPPIPVISQREICVHLVYEKDKLGAGKHIIAGKSIEHPDAPIGTGIMDYVRATSHCMAMVIESNPDGEGSKITEVRKMSLNG